jgi:hypothetical protein
VQVEVATPMAIASLIGPLVMTWATLGGFGIVLVDKGGAYRTRATAMSAAALGSALAAGRDRRARVGGGDPRARSAVRLLGKPERSAAAPAVPADLQLSIIAEAVGRTAAVTHPASPGVQT